MARRFNTAGVCRPEDHYMLPPEARLGDLRGLIDAKSCFVLHAPRQSGKTTSALLLAEALSAEGRYAAVLASCKPGAVAGGDVERGVGAVLGSLDQECRNQLDADLRPPPAAEVAELAPEFRLKEYLARWCARCTRPVVLFLDEIDALADDTLLSVLDQLHAGYPSRPERFPHAVGLIGLRDVRDYKIARRDGLGRLGSSSPFNIKSDSLTLRNFSAGEVAELYRQHTEETGQPFHPEAAARAFEITGGQLAVERRVGAPPPALLRSRGPAGVHGLAAPGGQRRRRARDAARRGGGDRPRVRRRQRPHRPPGPLAATRGRRRAVRRRAQGASGRSGRPPR